MFRSRVIQAMLLTMMTLGLAATALAHDPDKEDGADDKPEFGWSDTAELSLVITEGNSSTVTFGFKNTLVRQWKIGKFQLKLNGTRSEAADDPFLQVEPDIVIDLSDLPDPSEVPTTLVDPERDPDTEIFFIEGKFDRKLGKRQSATGGASWDRNRDAGILSRTIVFGTYGNLWWSGKEDFGFHTSYGLSFTDREEETPDPEKDEQFPGIRLHWDYLNKWGKFARYKNEWTTNFNLKDFNDWSSDMTNSITVKLSNRMALSISLQWLYNNEPALQDVDVIARVDIVDPDPAVPGDEFIITVPEGGFVVELGESRTRRKKLDTLFNTSLVLNF